MKLIIPAATNSLNSLGTFIQRENYKNNIYPKTAPEPIDLWYEKPLYGKINHQGVCSVLSEGFLKQFRTKGDNAVFGINFVVDAFEDFNKFYRNAVLHGKINTQNSELIELIPASGWRSANELYSEYINSIYKVFSKVFLADKNRGNKITNFDTFMKYFIEFVEIVSPTYPLSKSSFIRSRFCPIDVSGMSISIKDENHALDNKKYTSFLQDNNFSFYSFTAQKFGFFVDKNAPWRLVANLDSPAMLPYLKRYNLTSPNVFDTMFYDVLDAEVDTLIVYAVQFYNSYVSQNPFSAQKEIIGRKQITISLAKLKYNMNYWLRCYLFIRAKESDKVLSQSDFDHIAKKTIGIAKSLDLKSALWYIDSKFREPNQRIKDEIESPGILSSKLSSLVLLNTNNKDFSF